ncbi:MAG: hypothetical protein ACREIA_00020 [Opitutaceae bacterium]
MSAGVQAGAQQRQRDARAWKLTAVFTLAAAGVFLGLRRLPLASGSLHYTDFHAGGKTFLEFCEPGSPQFVPVDRVRSPVTLSIAPKGHPVAGERMRATLQLLAASGEPVTADDLLVVHTQKLHLLLVDPSLDDYHHVHPVATGEPGEFRFEFIPRAAGVYRVFGDFTPRATGRALYAGASIEVLPADPGGTTSPAAAGSAAGGNEDDTEVVPPGIVERRIWSEIEKDGHVFSLNASKTPLRINETSELTLRVSRRDGGAVELEQVMDAKAHLVAFDAQRSGFAHLHPKESSSTRSSGGEELGFTLNLADPGYYRLWAQVKLEGREIYAPFGLTVEP